MNDEKQSGETRHAGETSAAQRADRGSQYCAHEYQRLLRDYAAICSMSAKGHCYDNAAMESWNHRLKVEAIHGERRTTHAIACAHVFDYIEVHCRRQRLHSTPGYTSPRPFEISHVA